MLYVLIKRAASCVGALRKVAAVVCIVSASSAQNTVILSAIERHAWMSVRFVLKLAVGALDSGAEDCASASGADRHNGETLRYVWRYAWQLRAERSENSVSYGKPPAAL